MPSPQLHGSEGCPRMSLEIVNFLKRQIYFCLHCRLKSKHINCLTAMTFQQQAANNTRTAEPTCTLLALQAHPIPPREQNNT